MHKIQKLNIAIILITLFLCIFGMVMIYSASSYSSQILHDDTFYFVKKQLFGFILGVVLFIIG